MYCKWLTTLKCVKLSENFKLSKLDNESRIESHGPTGWSLNIITNICLVTLTQNSWSFWVYWHRYIKKLFLLINKALIPSSPSYKHRRRILTKRKWSCHIFTSFISWSRILTFVLYQKKGLDLLKRTYRTTHHVC